MSKIIASYPRSGSTWIRFILFNLIYPNLEASFENVNRYIPSIDTDAWVNNDHSKFYKTHRILPVDNIIFLHRHIGDVLISEYWYKKKFHFDERSFGEYLIACDYGKEWRTHVSFYITNHKYLLSYEDMHDAKNIVSLIKAINLPYNKNEIYRAIQKSDFEKMQQAELVGLGGYDAGDTSIKFVREGTCGQYLDLPKEIIEKILEKNNLQLKLLGYDVGL